MAPVSVSTILQYIFLGTYPLWRLQAKFPHFRGGQTRQFLSECKRRFVVLPLNFGAFGGGRPWTREYLREDCACVCSVCLCVRVCVRVCVWGCMCACVACVCVWGCVCEGVCEGVCVVCVHTRVCVRVCFYNKEGLQFGGCTHAPNSFGGNLTARRDFYSSDALPVGQKQSGCDLLK